MGESYRKLSFVDDTGEITGLSFKARYEKMDREDKPKVEARVGTTVVQFKSTYGNDVLVEGSTKKMWVDANGKVYEASQVKYYYEGEEVHQKQKTEVFRISAFQPLSSYTDMYVIDKFYEVYPDLGDSKKDFDKECSRKGNLLGMYKLWEYLDSKGVVARGSFNVSSTGFLESDGYVRAIKFGNKWGIEIGLFKEEKVFQHLNEGRPVEEAGTGAVPNGAVRLKLKRI